MPSFPKVLLHLTVSLQAISLAGCASVSVIPLTADGQPKNEASGIRYYMPKPYLLVTSVPADTVLSGQSAGPDTSGRPADIPATPTPTPSKSPGPTPNDQSKTANQASPSDSSLSSSSDLSYSKNNNTYLLKLIYLPDISQTMAINLVPGIFGTSSIQPTLQDGWMLTSLQSSADNSKAIDDMTSLATALLGGGAKTSTTKTPTAKAAAIHNGAVPPPDNSDVLPVGLYEFQYDSDGHLTGLCRVSKFSSSGVTNSQCRSMNALAALNIVRAKY